MKSVSLRSSRGSACISCSQREEAVSDRMEMPSADTGRMRSDAKSGAGRFMLTLF